MVNLFFPNFLRILRCGRISKVSCFVCQVSKSISILHCIYGDICNAYRVVSLRQNFLELLNIIVSSAYLVLMTNACLNSTPTFLYWFFKRSYRSIIMMAKHNAHELHSTLIYYSHYIYIDVFIIYSYNGCLIPVKTCSWLVLFPKKMSSQYICYHKYHENPCYFLFHRVFIFLNDHKKTRFHVHVSLPIFFLSRLFSANIWTVKFLFL